MKKLLIIFLFILIYAVAYNIGVNKNTELRNKEDTVTKILDTLVKECEEVYSIPEDILLGDPKSNLYQVLKFYNIQYPKIAYAIAVYETGWFKSDLCIKYNNLFGLYDSKHHRYYHFNNWYESVIKYKEWIEDKYDGEENYLIFLKKLPYSENKYYIQQLKVIMKKLNK